MKKSLIRGGRGSLILDLFLNFTFFFLVASLNININISIDQCCLGADPYSLPSLLCSRRALSLCLKVLIIIVVVFVSTTGALVVITV